MLKTVTRAGVLFILVAMCLVALIVVSSVELYHHWQADPGQAALAGLVVVGLIALSVLKGKK